MVRGLLIGAAVLILAFSPAGSGFAERGGGGHGGGGRGGGGGHSSGGSGAAVAAMDPVRPPVVLRAKRQVEAEAAARQPVGAVVAQDEVVPQQVRPPAEAAAPGVGAAQSTQVVGVSARA